MSNDDGLNIWVGDLGGYINLEGIWADRQREDAEEAEREKLERELNEIGEIKLLAGKATSAMQLSKNGITPSDWRHALHQAQMAIGAEPDTILQNHTPGKEGAEGRFIRSMLDLGRTYGVARYARWERLDYPTAITAMLPHGIRALVNQFLATERISRSFGTDRRIRSALSTGNIKETTSYRRTAALQAALHAIADEAQSHPGGAALDRERTRSILSLTRLYFSGVELRLSSLQELRALMSAYVTDRETGIPADARITSNGRDIRGWHLRHMRPLLDLYPFSIRYGLHRAMESSTLPREAIVNELALAHCGVLRMRRAGRDRTRRK